MVDPRINEWSTLCVSRPELDAQALSDHLWKWLQAQGREVLFGWFTTAPHPWKKAHRHSADQGQVGWKLHAVPLAHDREDYEEGFRPIALCGCWPRHGWGMDLFIEDECRRCTSIMERRELQGEPFIDAPERRRRLQEAAELAAAQETSEPDFEWPFPV